VALRPKAVQETVHDLLFPAFKKERERLDRIDKWWRWDHESPHSPRYATREYKELAGRSQSPWLGLIVSSVVQHLYVDDFRRSEDNQSAEQWAWWQANGMDSRQTAIHRAAIAYGLAYATVLPGEDDLGNDMPVIRGISPRRMIALYGEPEYDDWPRLALRGDPAKVDDQMGWALRVYDDTSVYYLNCDAGGDGVTFIERRDHNLGLCPVVRYTNQRDLEGRAPGEVEPYIPLAARIDQTTFDRLVVQRFASWKVRTVAGMSMAETVDATGATPEQVKLNLKISDFLMSDNENTKFGTLDETPLEGFVKAKEADIKELASVSQTPAHELLGVMANLSAEAIAAGRASFDSKVEERRVDLGESHEQTLRLSSWVKGDKDGFLDRSAQVRWRDTSIRSLAQAADAITKLKDILPVEMCLEKLPDFTRQDVDRAMSLRKEDDSLGQLAEILDRQTA
jgi:hypothetical protein